MSTPKIDLYKSAYRRICDHVEKYQDYIRNTTDVPYHNLHLKICDILDNTKINVNTDHVTPHDIIFAISDYEKLEIGISKTVQAVLTENAPVTISCVSSLIQHILGFIQFRYILFLVCQEDPSDDQKLQFNKLRVTMFRLYLTEHDASADTVGKVVGRSARWVKAFFTKSNDDLSIRDIGIMTVALNCELSVSITAREDNENA